MNSYQNGKIYIIELIPFLPYIGSTVQKLEYRYRKHKHNNNDTSSKCLFEAGNPVISLLEEYPSDTKRELDKREQYWIDQIECINKFRAYVTREEYIEEMKQYYQKNKEQLLETQKQRYEQNKEQILEKKRCKTTCNKCGSVVQYSIMSRHKRSIKCLNFVN